MSPRVRRLRVAAVYAAVAIAGLAVRAPALRENPTPDAAEYEMIGRSLARGEGFVLPVRVRHDTIGPITHDARGERAPLFPVFLSLLVRAGLDDDRPGIAPGLQTANALLGVLDALLVTWLAFALALPIVHAKSAARDDRADGACAAIALAAGLAAAWSPPLCSSSTRLLAEPLGIFFLLLAARAEIAIARGQSGGLALGIASGLTLALARLARPEAAAVLIIVLVLRTLALVRRSREHTLAFAGTLAGASVVTAAALVAGAGVPQTFLLRVTSFDDVMFHYGKAEPPAATVLTFVAGHTGEIARRILWNAGSSLVEFVRAFWALPVLALLALLGGERASRRIALLGWGSLALTWCIWATDDHRRFLAAPAALLAGPAAVEGARIVRRLLDLWTVRAVTTARLAILLVAALTWCGRPLVRQIDEARRMLEPEAELESVWHGAHLDGIAARIAGLPEGAAFAAVSPWGLALRSGRPGLLLPNKLEAGSLRSFLSAYPEVHAVVLRSDNLSAHARGHLDEPLAYAAALNGHARTEIIAGATVLFLKPEGTER